MTSDKEYKGFLVIKKAYRVRCQFCGFRGKANLGKEPILTEEADGADWCPVCGALALVADNAKTQPKP